jgi:hypothetical protein
MTKEENIGLFCDKCRQTPCNCEKYDMQPIVNIIDEASLKLQKLLIDKNMSLSKINLLVDFQKWEQENPFHVLNLNEKELAKMFLSHLQNEELKKDELYKKNFIR